MHCEVIAEVGHNHQGSYEIALKMVEAAARAGADAVKFQKRDNRHLYTKSFYDSPYNSENAFGPTYGAHREALELSASDYVGLLAAAKDKGLKFYCTAFDAPSLEFLVGLGVDGIKIASGDLTNTPLIEKTKLTGLPVLLSTGGGTMKDVCRAMDVLRGAWTRLTVMQCTASYPTPFEYLDLGVISTYVKKFPQVRAGASLHDNGIWSAVAAYVLGARCIEKHFTLDRSMKGTDQAFSLEPQGLAKVVRDLRRVETALGAEKRVHPSEEGPILKMGKSCFASRPLTKGTVLAEGDIVCKSPGGYLPPYELHKLVGHTLLRDLGEEEPFTLEVVDAEAGSPAGVLRTP